MADAGPRRHQDLLVGLVVAVHVDAGRVEARGERDVQLAAGGDVDREPLLGEQPVGGGGGEGLAGEEHLAIDTAALEGLAVGAGAGAQVVLGVDVGGGADALRPTSTTSQPPTSRWPCSFSRLPIGSTAEPATGSRATAPT